MAHQKSSIRNWIKAGKLEARKDGKTWKISEKALKKQISEQMDESTMSEENLARIAGKDTRHIRANPSQASKMESHVAWR